MIIEINGFALELGLRAWQDGHWRTLPLLRGERGLRVDHRGLKAELDLQISAQTIAFDLRFTSPTATRLRLALSLRDQANLFHLIPGNIHGDNNAAHVRAGEFPCLTSDRLFEQNRSPLWEFRADRASHPVSILCCDAGAAGISIDPYSDCEETDEGFVRNGVFAALPDGFGVSLGYGNDPLTFVEKTCFRAATCDLTHGASASGTIHAVRGEGRQAAHRIIRAIYETTRELPQHRRTPQAALAALSEAFTKMNFQPQLQQYTNRRTNVPVDKTLMPWRAIVEIGWTGGSMLAYPFMLAEKINPALSHPKSGERIFDEICDGFNEASGFINDACLNRSAQNRPPGWNESEINGWWSGFLPQTRDNHCAYTNAHAAYYLLRTLQVLKVDRSRWLETACRVLDTAIELQREDGAFGYIFSGKEKKVIDWDGFAGCWFTAALPLAWKLTGKQQYLAAAERSIRYYRDFVRDLICWGSPMDTFKSNDSEGNLAFIRAARLLHEFAGKDAYLPMLEEGAHYEYLWRYGFRARPQCPPLKNSSWNSCGGTITSVSNPHIHPMGVVATTDLEYLARSSGDNYHQRRADDGIAWLLNTMELYPDTMGYGRYGVLSERTCPSDGLLSEQFYDDGSPASTWWSYNAWAAGSAMEALGEKIYLNNERVDGCHRESL